MKLIAVLHFDNETFRVSFRLCAVISQGFGAFQISVVYIAGNVFLTEAGGVEVFYILITFTYRIYQIAKILINYPVRA